MPALHDAIRERDLERVRTLLAQGADPNEADEDDLPLSLACLSRDEEDDERPSLAVPIAEALIAAGARVSPEGACAYSPLHAAALAGCDDLVRLLLAHGADPRCGDSPAETEAELRMIHGDGPRARGAVRALRLLDAWYAERGVEPPDTRAFRIADGRWVRVERLLYGCDPAGADADAVASALGLSPGVHVLRREDARPQEFVGARLVSAHPVRGDDPGARSELGVVVRCPGVRPPALRLFDALPRGAWERWATDVPRPAAVE